jgi:phosphomannomutase
MHFPEIAKSGPSPEETMRPLKISIAGVRGVVGETFTPELAVSFAAAFGTYIAVEDRPKVVFLSRDTRPSGEMLAAAVRAGLTATGCEVIDLGVCPTPVMQWAVRQASEQCSEQGRPIACGGMAITAGHSAEEWNALKFIGSDGTYLSQYEGAELLDHFHHARPAWQDAYHLGSIRRDTEQARQRAILQHRQRLFQTLAVEAIRQRRFKVALDCCNGSCCLTSPDLLRQLNCEVVVINDEPDRPYPHPPEPNPQNMSQLRALVRASGADLGFAHDADGDRLGLVTNTGEPLLAQFTFCLAVQQVLAHQTGDCTVVTNLSTTRRIDDIARQYTASGAGRCRVERTRVGQSYILEAMRLYGGIVGGEGSGGVMFRDMHLVQDSMATMGHILQLLAEQEGSLNDLVAALPVYHWREESIPLPPPRLHAVLQQFRDLAAQEAEGARVDLTEGVRLDWEEGWLHVRASITEPILRLIAEATTAARAEDLLEWARRYIRT